MKYICLWLLMLLFPAWLAAQPNPTFVRTYSFSQPYHPQAVCDAGNNDYLIAEYGSHLCKIHDDGSFAWTKSYTFPNPYYFGSVTKVPSGYVASGWQQVTANSSYDQQLTITEVDTSGAVLWSTRLDSTVASLNLTRPMPDGGVMTAYVMSIPTATSMKICRLSATGTLLWHNMYQVLSTQGMITDMCADPAHPGFFVVLGKHSNGTASMLYEIDSTGQVLWAWTHSLSSSNLPRGIAQRNGGYAFCNTNSIVSISPGGAILQTQTFAPATGFMEFNHISSSQDGGLIITGRYNALYPLTLKTDSMLNLQWAFYNTSFTATPIQAVESSDGDPVIPCRWDSAWVPYTYTAMLHLNSSGFAGCHDVPLTVSVNPASVNNTAAPLTVTPATVSVIHDAPVVSADPVYNAVVCAFTGQEENDIEPSVSLYPNPTNGHVRLNQPMEKETLLRVFDAAGKCCAVQKINGQEIDLTALENGMYFLEFLSGEEVLMKHIVIIH